MISGPHKAPVQSIQPIANEVIVCLTVKNPPKTEYRFLHAGVFDTVAYAILSPYVTYLYMYVRMLVHILADLQSIQLRNATTTTVRRVRSSYLDRWFP